MDNKDNDVKDSFSMLRCMRTAMEITGRHVRSTLDRLSRLFSSLNCVSVNVKEGERRYSRKLTEREKAFIVRGVQRNLDSKFAKGHVSRSSSYDSLADETLSIRASTLTSPATSIDYSTESGTTTDSSSISSNDYEHSLNEFSYRDKCSPPSRSPVFTTPVRTFSMTSIERLPGPGISKSLPEVLDPKKSDASSVLSSDVSSVLSSDVSSVLSNVSGSPVSYYRSSVDLNFEDVNDLDDGFWDATPPKH